MYNQTKKEKRERELCNRMLSYPDMVREFGLEVWQLDKKMGIDLVASKTVKGCPAAKNLCNDIVDVYNSKEEKGRKIIFTGCFRSNKVEKLNEYHDRIHKEVVRAIQRKYGCGIDFGGLSLTEISEGFQLFLEQVKI